MSAAALLHGLCGAPGWRQNRWWTRPEYTCITGGAQIHHTGHRLFKVPSPSAHHQHVHPARVILPPTPHNLFWLWVTWTWISKPALVKMSRDSQELAPDRNSLTGTRIEDKHQFFIPIPSFPKYVPFPSLLSNKILNQFGVRLNAPGKGYSFTASCFIKKKKRSLPVHFPLS